MVTQYKIFITIQPRQCTINKIFITGHSKITQDPYGIILGYYRVPIVDNSIVHFFNGIEWPLTVFYYICVVNVQIACKENHRYSPIKGGRHSFLMASIIQGFVSFAKNLSAIVSLAFNADNGFLNDLVTLILYSFISFYHGTTGGTRTLMRFLSADFESAA